MKVGDSNIMFEAVQGGDALDLHQNGQRQCQYNCNGVKRAFMPLSQSPFLQKQGKDLRRCMAADTQFDLEWLIEYMGILGVSYRRDKVGLHRSLLPNRPIQTPHRPLSFQRLAGLYFHMGLRTRDSSRNGFTF